MRSFLPRSTFYVLHSTNASAAAKADTSPKRFILLLLVVFAGTAHAANLTVNGTYELTGNTSENYTGIFVGETMPSTLNIKDSAWLTSSGTFYIGDNADGTVNLSGGTLDYTGGNFWIGWWGRGVMNVSGGTASVNTAIIVYNNELNISGGALNAANSAALVGWDGPSFFTISGGTANLYSINMNHSASRFYLTGGTLNLGAGGIYGNANCTNSLGGGIVKAAAAWSSSLPIRLTGTGGAVTFDPNGYDIALSGGLSGFDNLVVNATGGTGSLILSGTNNTCLGDTEVQGGTLTLSNACLSAGDDVYLAGSATLNLAFSGTNTIRYLYSNGVSLVTGTWGAAGSGADHESPLITGTGRLLVRFQAGGTEPPAVFYWTNTASGAWSDAANWTNNTGSITAPDAVGQTNFVLNFNQAGTYTATNDLSSGFRLNQLNFGAGTVTLSGNGLTLMRNGIVPPTINQNSGNAVTIGNNLALYTDASVGGPGTGDVAVAGVISGAGGLIKTNSGMLTLSAANTYTGGTVVRVGTLSINSAGAVNSRNVTLDGGTLQSTGGYPPPITVGPGGGTYRATGERLTQWNNYAALDITGSGDFYLYSDGTEMFNACQDWGGNPLGYTLTGDFVVMEIAGTILIGSMPNSTLDIRAPLGVNGFSMRHSGGLPVPRWLGGLKGSGPLPLWIDAGEVSDIFVGNNNKDTTYSGVMSGDLPWTKMGTGTLTLTGINTYSGGTTISNGTLLVNNTSGSGTGTGAVTNKSGATLGGVGTISGPVTVEGGGHLAPGGTNGIGTLILSGAGACLTFSDNGVLDCEIDGNNEAYTNDVVNLSGSGSTINFGASASLNLYSLRGITPTLIGRDIVLFKYTGDDPVLPVWTINYGNTGWSGARVMIDSDNKQIVLRGVPKGTILIAR